MAQRPATHFGDDFAPRGLSLAERRLTYLAELYDSGRWRRYHGEADFLAQVRQARAAVDTWRRLLRPAPIDTGQCPAALPPVGGVVFAAPADSGDVERIELAPLDTEPLSWLRRSERLPPIVFSAHDVVAEGDLAEA